MIVPKQVYERWPMIETLSRLGWTAEAIAEAIGWSRGTVLHDWRTQGGVNRLFPDRPRTTQSVYAATFRAYTQSHGCDERLRPAIESLLDIPRLRTAADAMARAYLALCLPVYPPEYQPYVNLVLDILDRQPVEPSALWESYLQRVRTSSVNAPTSADDAVDALARLLATDADRRNLMNGTSFDLKEVIDGWLTDYSTGTLDSRQTYILARNYGLKSLHQQTLAEIGEDLGFTREAARQIKNEILHRLRRHPYADQLCSIFPSMGDLAHRAREYDRIVASQTQRVAEIPPTQIQDPEQRARMLAYLHRRCDEFYLPVRAAKCLDTIGIEYIWQLCEMSEADLLKHRNFHRMSLNAIKDLLARIGLELKMNLRALLGEDAPYRT